MNKEIMKTRVVSRNLFLDFTSHIRNALGKRLIPYEKMLVKAKEDIWKELNEEKIKLSWFRYEITPLTSGALVIMLYGERK